MESTYLKTFVEVARSGSLTKAARTFCITQSAVSRRIKFLEDHYGYPLLDRSGPILVPTEHGALLIEKALKVLAIEDELRLGLRSVAGRLGLSFVCTPTFGIVHLPEIMRDFIFSRVDASDLKFTFEMPEKIILGLREGLYEMAVIEHCQHFDLSDFDTFPLSEDEMVFASAPGLGIDPWIESIDRLLVHTLFGRNDGCCSRTLLENNLKASNRTIQDFKRLIICDDLNIIVRALINGDGIAFISNELVAPYVREGKLVISKVAGFTHQRHRTFVFNGCFPEQSIGAQFMEMVCKRFSCDCDVNKRLAGNDSNL